VVINPHNGPGINPLPDSNYLRHVPTLSRQPNVTLLGYVHVSYCQRPLPEVIRDITTFSEWATHKDSHPDLFVSGIMVDEVPWEFQPQHLKYLSEVAQATRRDEQFGRSGMVSNSCLVVISNGGAP
jgi:hypothetical protein